MSSKKKPLASKTNSKDGQDIELPSTSVNEPFVPTTSVNAGPIVEASPPESASKPWWQRCLTYMYDRESKLFCERSCKSWLYMIIYSIMYLIFLSTYTMIFLYATLTIIKAREVYRAVDRTVISGLTYNGVGLTATPTSLDSDPLISYTKGHSEEYNKYIKALDEFLIKRRKRQVGVVTDLGPCGEAPYGYGDKPCIILRPNKQLRWSANPINRNSSNNLPKELKKWLELKEQKLWLHCDGYHSYDKEHIGRINYYPYPPGFDPSVFPLDMRSDAPLVAIQISNFTLGLSLTVECKLWYDSGISSVTFLLYVEPKSRSVTYKTV